MNLLSSSLLTLMLVFDLLASATFAKDIRDKVQPAAGATTIESVIDTQGIVYGVPFGTTEDGVIQKFGKPSGYLRLDAHRTALLYGKSYLLLCYDGNLDGIVIDPSVLNWAVSGWAKETAPFIYDDWRLSNGIKSGMNLKQVEVIVKAEPATTQDQLTFSTEQCLVRFGFSHWPDRGDGDETYTIYSFLMTRTHDGKDHWSELPPTGSLGQMMKGKKVIGAQVGDSPKGVRVTGVCKDSPADKAGIHVGDLVTSLNGESTIGMKAAEFSQRMTKQPVNKMEVTSKDQKTRLVQVESVDGATLSNQLASLPLVLTEVSVGEPAPDFEAMSAEGKQVKLSDLKGAPVLVEFTETGCKPCDEATQTIGLVYDKYKGQGLKVISVYLDKHDNDLFAYEKTLGGSWPINVDGKGWENVVARTYGVNGVPAVALIGKDGTILKTNLYKTRIASAVKEALE